MTDSKETSAMLKETKAQLQSLMETMTEGIIFLDKTQKITCINSALERMLGIGRNKIVGSYFRDVRWRFMLLDGEKVREDDLIFDEILERGQTFYAKEYIWEIYGGKRFILSINAAPCVDENNNIIGALAVMTDITERQRIKDEAQEIKEVYERLTRYADEAIFRLQAENRKVIYINEAAEKILGYSLADFLSKPDLPVKSILPEYYPIFTKAFKELEEGRNVVRDMVLGIKTKEGRTVMMEFTTIAVRDKNNNINYYEALGRDITVRRFLEQELAKSQKLESIGLLAGGIAHDFNNILTVILGLLGLAKMDTQPSSSLYEKLNQAEDHCLKAKSLTHRLLTYSRSGSLVRKTASIGKILREATNFALSGKNAKCKFNIADGLWSAQINEGQMHQVVHYLVINAVEAMPDGGIIEIDAQNATLAGNQVPPLPAGNYIKWHVKDHGMGIPKEHMQKLFDPYFTTKQMGNIKGMGLGLAICYSIIKSHEGLISVESEPGYGTTFTVYIPALAEESMENKPESEEETQFVQKHRILLIDDEKILLDVTSSMLDHLGYEVTTAENHKEALNIYREAKDTGRPFSLIIMDLTMRDNEGGDTAIRKWSALYPEVKAVISSGYANDPVIEDYEKYGFVGAMIKPYTLIELKKTLEKILSAR